MKTGDSQTIYRTFAIPDPRLAFEAAYRSFITQPDENTLLLLQATAHPFLPRQVTATAGCETDADGTTVGVTK